MKTALNATRYSEITTLRLKRQKVEASVERSFVELQMKCQATQDAWHIREWPNGPMQASPLHVSSEQKEIQRVMCTGRSRINQFKASAPRPDSFEFEELETYFVDADRTSLEFKRLASQLPQPKSLYH